MATTYAGATGHVDGGTETIHTGRGALLYLLVSHAESTPQTVTLYDNNTAGAPILTKVTVAPEQSPAPIRFPHKFPLRFNAGLTVDAGNCSVTLIATGGN